MSHSLFLLATLMKTLTKVGIQTAREKGVVVVDATTLAIETRLPMKSMCAGIETLYMAKRKTIGI